MALTTVSSQIIYIFDRQMESLDITTRVGAWQFATILIRIANVQSKILADRFAEVKADLTKRLNMDENSGDAVRGHGEWIIRCPNCHRTSYNNEPRVDHLRREAGPVQVQRTTCVVNVMPAVRVGKAPREALVREAGLELVQARKSRIVTAAPRVKTAVQVEPKIRAFRARPVVENARKGKDKKAK